MFWQITKSLPIRSEIQKRGKTYFILFYNFRFFIVKDASRIFLKYNLSYKAVSSTYKHVLWSVRCQNIGTTSNICICFHF